MADNDSKFYPEFDKYINWGNPEQKRRAEIWRAAIGLQVMNDLTVSEYLKQIAKKNIEGTTSFKEVCRLVESYYQSRDIREIDEYRMQEADMVSANIARALSSDSFFFMAEGYTMLHGRIFEGVLTNAGKMRESDISREEIVLEGDSVSYLHWEDIPGALEYYIERERKFSYQGLSQDEKISHISRFIADIWQIHAFKKGSTRTTAVFAIQYLRSVGFKINYNMFACHSEYFRNALVRANYKNIVKGIDYSPEYLERFFRNMFLEDQWALLSCYLRIYSSGIWGDQPNLADKTGQVQDKFKENDPNIEQIVITLGVKYKPLKELMYDLKLRGRDNFLKLYLKPAINKGYVKMLYPKSPHHPRQRYKLTRKGFILWDLVAKMERPLFT